jgi:hypothetical protein
MRFRWTFTMSHRIQVNFRITTKYAGSAIAINRALHTIAAYARGVL